MGGGGEADAVEGGEGARAEPQAYEVEVRIELELELAEEAVATSAADADVKDGAADTGAGAGDKGGDVEDPLTVAVRHTLWGEDTVTEFAPLIVDATPAPAGEAPVSVALSCAPATTATEGEEATDPPCHCFEPMAECVRALVASSGAHILEVDLSRKGCEPVALTLEVDCSGLLVGDLRAQSSVGAPGLPAGATSLGVCGVRTIVVLSRPLLSPELAESLNPLVVSPAELVDLPDLPSSRELLEQRCEMPHIVMSLPGVDEPILQSATDVSAWRIVDSEMRLSARTAAFSGVRPTVVLAGELDQAELFRRCLEGPPIEVLVYDRTERAEEDVTTYDVVESVEKPPPDGEDANGNGDAGVAAAAVAASAGVMGRAEPGHGAVRVSLAQFANGYRSIDLDAPVVPISRMLTNGQDPSWTTRPGLYMQAQTELRMRLRLAAPLKRPDVERPFVRLVAIMAYEDTEMLMALLTAARSHNVAALGLQGSANHVLKTLVTYQFSEAQRADRTLDVVTGFQLIDGESRVLVVEGLPQGALRELLAAVRELCTPTRRKDWPRRRVLVNDGLAHQQRLYDGLGADIQPLKLRAKLHAIVAAPGTFATGNVKEDCMVAVKRLHALSQQRWMRQVEEMQLLPTEDMLLAIDKKFGGGLTQADLEGVPRDDSGGAVECNDANASGMGDGGAGARAGARGRGNGSADATDALGDAPEVDAHVQIQGGEVNVNDGQGVESAGGDTVLGYAPTLRRRASRKGYTDNTNTTYDAFRASAATRVFNAHQRNLETMRATENTLGVELRHQHAKWLAKGIWANARKSDDTNNAHAHKQAHGRATATSAPHSERARTAASAGSHVRCTTAPSIGKLFKWPSAKTKEEFMRNLCPKKPSAARAEELEQEWVENELHNLTIPRGGGTIAHADDFKVRVPMGNLFELDPEKFKSVHLTGDGLAEEQRLAREAEEKAWADKIVVDTVHMNTSMPTKPDRVVEGLDKTSTILHDAPRTVGLTTIKRRADGGTERIAMVDRSIEGSRSLFLGPHETTVDIARTLRQPAPHRWLGGDFDATKLPASMRTSVGARGISPLKSSERNAAAYTEASMREPFVAPEGLTLYGKVTKDSPVSVRKQAAWVPPEGLSMYGRVKPPESTRRDEEGSAMPK